MNKVDDMQLNSTAHAVLGIALMALLGISAWSLRTINSVATSTSVQAVEIEHLKQDLGSLTQSIQATLARKVERSKIENMERRVSDMETGARRLWDRINSEHQGNGK